MTGLSTDRVHVRALGVTVAIDVRDDRLRPLVRQAWSMAVVARPDAGGPVVVAPDLAPDASGDEVALALQLLTQAVTHAAISARLGELVMFHAAGLCDQRTGATIALVAPGGTGKTTLVRSLGRSRGYVSDETVGVAADGSVEAYCKPLSIRRHVAGQPKDEVAPDSVGLHVPSGRPWLAGIVLLRRDLPPGDITVEPVDVLDALVLLAPETSGLSRFDKPLHRLAELLDSVGGLRLVRYHDAADLEPLVDDVLGSIR